MKLAVDSNGEIVQFKEVIPMFDFIMRGSDNLIGKYWIWNWKGHPTGFKCALIDERWVKTDIRFFQLNFIIHHNLSVGII